MSLNEIGTTPNQDFLSPLILELHLMIAENLRVRDFFQLKQVSNGIYHKTTAIESICFRNIAFVLGPFCSALQAQALLQGFGSRSIKDISRFCNKSFLSCFNAIAEKSSIPTFSKAKRALHWVQEPRNLSAFANVRYLKLSNLNLTVLPEQISSCVSLRLLDLSGNQLHFLPSTIGKLKNLFWFYCSQNQLETIPPEIGDLEQMTILDITSNPLHFLPKEMGKLRKLVWLILNQSHESLLPNEIWGVEELTIDLMIEFQMISLARHSGG